MEEAGSVSDSSSELKRLFPCDATPNSAARLPSGGAGARGEVRPGGSNGHRSRKALSCPDGQCIARSCWRAPTIYLHLHMPGDRECCGAPANHLGRAVSRRLASLASFAVIKPVPREGAGTQLSCVGTLSGRRAGTLTRCRYDHQENEEQSAPSCQPERGPPAGGGRGGAPPAQPQGPGQDLRAGNRAPRRQGSQGQPP